MSPWFVPWREFEELGEAVERADNGDVLEPNRAIRRAREAYRETKQGENEE